MKQLPLYPFLQLWRQLLEYLLIIDTVVVVMVVEAGDLLEHGQVLRRQLANVPNPIVLDKIELEALLNLLSLPAD